MVMLRGEHSTERGEGNTEKVIMTELPRRVWFFYGNRRFSLRNRGKRKHAERLKGRAP